MRLYVSYIIGGYVDVDNKFKNLKKDFNSGLYSELKNTIENSDVDWDEDVDRLTFIKDTEDNHIIKHCELGDMDWMFDNKS